ncbi:hypothetical protein GNX71_28665 [Variovorax sp. RKNM96]|uniref:hypothetical protein n=1 Tax=Variovorax sp. RKNM96 TaxID=2681552 RepID=UPI00197F0CD2|nr:hypothetical protein [Variovorax sp. RKNM96]QSI33323.1 hypothetical protein GNX71_28665 [Variovorax sp. RKNM96]
MANNLRNIEAAQSPVNWVRRRARRLERFYQVSRREAVANAWQDWASFHPIAARSAWVH